MFRTESFFSDEISSPLLARLFDFVTPANLEERLERAGQWRDMMSSEVELEEAEKCDSEEFLRIFRRDAERTYVFKDHDEAANARTIQRHESHVKILRLVVAETKDYHQGMGYIAAFLGLFFSEETAAKLIVGLHRQEKYCKGYFSAVPVKFVADARVVFEILSREDSELLKHMQSKGVFPEMFMSKWFIGLGLHVLPYEALFDFYEAFLTEGVDYIFKFSLAYFAKFRPEIMAAKTTSALMTVLRAEDENADWRLPKWMKPQDLIALVIHAKSITLPDDLQKLRDAEFLKVFEQVERAKKRAAEMAAQDNDSDDGNFTDEE